MLNISRPAAFSRTTAGLIFLLPIWHSRSKRRGTTDTKADLFKSLSRAPKKEPAIRGQPYKTKHQDNF
jgi:hypothetical protein